MKSALLFFFLLGVSVTRGSKAPFSAVDDADKGVVTVFLDGEQFTALHYRNFAKPVLSPIYGPTGMNFVRQWPMAEKAGPGEEMDHPHHKGLWFTHGAVNGVDFWAEGEKMGKIIVQGRPTVGKPGNVLTIDTIESWQAPDGKAVCNSATTISCGGDAGDRYIDYTITIKASEGDVTFGDTKEGTMGIRSHPALNLKGKVAAGHALNSEGQKDAGIWGKPARWVDYSGPIDGKVTGIACFDHPSNLRHPTTWHARDYGLIAANPFGLHDFDKKNAKGAGDHTIKKGGTLTFKYRWLFHSGDTAAAKIEDRWKVWAGK